MKNLYYSIKQDNTEIYVINLIKNWNDGKTVKELHSKLKAIRKLMPTSKWQITIEEQISTNDWIIFDVETKEFITR